jgi:hypothetical protein
MKTNLSITAFSVAVVSFARAFTISAQPAQPVAGTPSSLSSTELAERALERRAVEAIIWGMPAVNFDPLYQAMVQSKGEWNQVVFWSDHEGLELHGASLSPAKRNPRWHLEISGGAAAMIYFPR